MKEQKECLRQQEQWANIMKRNKRKFNFAYVLLKFN